MVHCYQVSSLKVFPALMTFDAESSLCGEGPALCCRVVTWAQPSMVAAAVGHAGHTPGQRCAVSWGSWAFRRECPQGATATQNLHPLPQPQPLPRGHRGCGSTCGASSVVHPRCRAFQEDRCSQLTATRLPVLSPSPLGPDSQLLAHRSLTQEPPPPTSSQGTRSVPTPVSSCWRRPLEYGTLASVPRALSDNRAPGLRVVSPLHTTRPERKQFQRPLSGPVEHHVAHPRSVPSVCVPRRTSVSEVTS